MLIRPPLSTCAARTIAISQFKIAQSVWHEQTMCIPKNGSGRVHIERVAKIQTSAILLRFYSDFALTAAGRHQPKARA